MATKKKDIKVRDLKPSKDAKGGAARKNLATSTRTADSRTRAPNAAKRTL